MYNGFFFITHRWVFPGVVFIASDMANAETLQKKKIRHIQHRRHWFDISHLVVFILSR